MNKDLINQELQSSYGYDFESEFFTDEIKTLYDEVISVAILIHNKKIKELEGEKLKAYNLGLSALNECIEEKKQLKYKTDELEEKLNKLNDDFRQLGFELENSDRDNVKLQAKICELEKANEELNECLLNADSLPIWTEIHIQPLDIDDIENSKIYWIKHPRKKWGVYDKNLTMAIKGFIKRLKNKNSKY